MSVIRAYRDKTPRVASDAFIAETATLIGDVSIGPGASVWYGAVLRGDVGWIRVGARSNVQDLVCVHMTTDLSNTDIGEDVTIGHGAIIHGAVIEDGTLIGMGAILLDNARIGTGAVIAAGAVLPPGTVVPPGTLVRGPAAKAVRELGADEIARLRQTAAHYVELGREHR
ncbi:MAG: gamma carbonic anhydrase family protein [Polyangiaceae bacterium]|nr:gamma carbonic anhydrase family protein [Polyangiaceae bacterium]